MSSEGSHGISPQPEPTCPMIDALIKSIRSADKAMSKYEKQDDPAALKEMLSAIDSELFHWGVAEDALEAIRKNAERIRSWGEEWKQYALALEKTTQPQAPHNG